MRYNPVMYMSKASEQLSEFISRARSAGRGDAEIRSMLVSSGWDESSVSAAIMSGGDLMPPPPPAPKSSGREIFFYLLQFFTLGTVAVSLGGVVFALINHYVTDEVTNMYYGYGPDVQSMLAPLIVGAPVFAAVTWKLVRDAAAARTSVRSGIRRVMTYLALFLASATVIGDVIALVYRFLAGEVNARFLLKVFTILIIGGWVIFYYYLTVKRDERGEAYPRRWHETHGIAFAVVALAAIVSGFVVGGTPQERQKFVRDQQRVSELQNLQWQVQSYYDKEQTMPLSLAALNPGYELVLPVDPLTNAAYRYEIGEGLSYQLCATFETDDKEDAAGKMRPLYQYDVNWTHPAGDYCFGLKVQERIAE